MPTAYVTAPPDAAEDIAHELVEDRLAACINRMECRSTFRWDGEVVGEDEQVLLVKTTEEAYPDVVERVEAIHPYDVPCVERFEETDVLPAFGAWIDDAVGGD